MRNARQNNFTIFDKNAHQIMTQYLMKNARQIMPQYAMKMCANNGHNKCDKKAQANARNFSPAKYAYLLAIFLG